MKSFPIIFNSKPDAAIFCFKDEVITNERFINDVIKVATNVTLPKYVINLCADRYLFAVTFVASILQKKICLLPASHAEIEILEDDYEYTRRVDDEFIGVLLEDKKASLKKIAFPEYIDSDQLVAIVFTSGSTGKPKANLKYWGGLIDSAKRVASRLNINKFNQHSLVATVPPQHMYGFETTIILPLVAGVCVYNSRPFFPEDIRLTLKAMHSPVILVTTPIHLRACIKTKIIWPEIDFVISATAPLSSRLAEDVEQQMGTTVYEIYGCSEAGVIATREPTQNPDWNILPGYTFTETLVGFNLMTPLLKEEISLPDMIVKINEQQFQLTGRQSDLVKIAGKRGSLNGLKLKLCALDGVEDAVFFMPEDFPDENARLAALVVAPDLSLKEITSFFNEQVDHAFMPRPLIKVEKLPYNESGKLPRKKLIDIFKQTRNVLKDSA